MTKSIPDLKAAVIDGRAEAPRFKQQQLFDLHIALQSSHQEIVEAICTDTGNTRAEAEFQYLLSVDAVKEHYSSLDVAKLLETEYSLAKSKDNVTRRVAYGCAYIRPDNYSLIYSVVTPVAAAIAAGNCVVVELPQTLRLTGTLIRKILAKALDQDSFAVVESDPFDNGFKKAHVVMLDAIATENAQSSSQSIRTSRARTAVVVDRTADVASAAREIVRARFAFGGQSAYSPDVVLVNEFSVKEFCSALAQSALSFLTTEVNGSAEKSHSKKSNAAAQGSLGKQIKDEEGVTILASGARGTVALVHDRDHKLLKTKITEPILLVHSITSMDDAIDFLNTSSEGAPLLATYIFSTPAAAKYLGQFISSDLSCTNHIPSELLIGPASPQGSTPQIHPRYNQDVFSRSSPQLLTKSTRSVALAGLIDGTIEAKSLAPKIDVSIQPMNEPKGGAIGFFEQGIMLGLGMRVSGIVVASLAFARYGYPILMSRLRWEK